MYVTVCITDIQQQLTDEWANCEHMQLTVVEFGASARCCCSLLLSSNKKQFHRAALRSGSSSASLTRSPTRLLNSTFILENMMFTMLWLLCREKLITQLICTNAGLKRSCRSVCVHVCTMLKMWCYLSHTGWWKCPMWFWCNCFTRNLAGGLVWRCGSFFRHKHSDVVIIWIIYSNHSSVFLLFVLNKTTFSTATDSEDRLCLLRCQMCECGCACCPCCFEVADLCRWFTGADDQPILPGIGRDEVKPHDEKTSSRQPEAAETVDTVQPAGEHSADQHKNNLTSEVKTKKQAVEEWKWNILIQEVLLSFCSSGKVKQS